ncbi:MAG: fasciclin domain-containing protein [Planctomycetota bacterium]
MRKLIALALAVALTGSFTAQAFAGCGTCDKTIVENAVNAKKFSILVDAVKAAGLAELLSGDGPFTVLAPTDEAFKKLPEGTIASLLKPENKEKLISILKLHVIPGKVMSKKVVTLDKAKTAAGSEVMIKVVDGKVMINDATVVTPDVNSSNGVIHIIDKVILPKA